MSKTLRIWTAALAGCQVLVAGAVLTEVMGAKWAALAALVVAAAQAGTAAYRASEREEDPA